MRTTHAAHECSDAGVSPTMTLHKRILDMLPALIVFACVAAFGTYVAVAYVVRDPWWLHTLATHTQAQAQRGPTASHGAAAAHTKAAPVTPAVRRDERGR